VIDAIEYGFVPGLPSFDCATILNRFVADKSLRRTIYFPSGSYWFNTQPQPISRTCTLIGDGTNGTSFVRNYVPEYSYSALLNITATSFVEKLSISAKTSGGCAVYLFGRGASASQLRSLTISKWEEGKTWAIPVLAHSLDPLGIRDLRLIDLSLFAATVHGMRLINTQGVTLRDVEYYPAGGTVSHVVIQNHGVFDPDPDNQDFKAANVKISTRYMPVVRAYGVKSMRIYSVGATKLVPDANCIDCKVVS
jgi:hypothetical protein